MIKLNSKLIRTVTFVVLAGTLVFGGIATSGSTLAVSENEAFVSELVDLTNEARAQVNESPLQIDEKLSLAARNKAVDMLESDYFAHISPSGKTPWYWMDQVQYTYIYAGENLAINFDTPTSTHAAWMASPTHRENIENAEFKEIGIAIAHGNLNGKEATIVVQMFGTEVE